MDNVLQYLSDDQGRRRTRGLLTHQATQSKYSVSLRKKRRTNNIYARHFNDLISLLLEMGCLDMAHSVAGLGRQSPPTRTAFPRGKWSENPAALEGLAGPLTADF